MRKNLLLPHPTIVTRLTNDREKEYGEGLRNVADSSLFFCKRSRSFGTVWFSISLLFRAVETVRKEMNLTRNALDYNSDNANVYSSA